MEECVLQCTSPARTTSTRNCDVGVLESLTNFPHSSALLFTLAYARKPTHQTQTLWQNKQPSVC